MRKIIATEQIFSPLSNGKPIAVKYHYADGTTKEVPAIREVERSELPGKLREAIEKFEERFRK